GQAVVVEGGADGAVGDRRDLVYGEVPVVGFRDRAGRAAGLKDGGGRNDAFENIDLRLEVWIEVAVGDANALDRRDRVEERYHHVGIVAQRDVDGFLEGQGAGLLVDAANVALADQALGRNIVAQRPLPGKDSRQRGDRVIVLEGCGTAVRHV